MHKNIFTKRITRFMLGMLACLSFGVIVLGIETSASGAELAHLELEANNLLAENDQLSEAIVKSASLTDFSEKSEGYSLIKPQRIIYITEQEVVAQLPL